MVIRIKVNSEDIDMGCRSNCDACPVALAILRVLHKKHPSAIASADLQIIRIRASETAPEWHAVTPYSVEQFMNRFDFGDVAAPFIARIEFKRTTDN